MKRADAARKLADEASQRDADLREDLKRRLENREQQLQAAAAEITRGNAIIERLSEQARAQQQKLRLRADVVKQQERRVADARRDLDSAKHEKELAVADSRREQDKRQQAEKDLEQANKKLDEAADLLEHNAAHYTVWHVRRECLWALASNDASILNDELRYSAEVARENPKNYQIWYHRRALVEKIGVEAAADELALISTALRDDAKNYHAWSNRLWVLKTYDMWAGELEFCTALLLSLIHI